MSGGTRYPVNLVDFREEASDRENLPQVRGAGTRCRAGTAPADAGPAGRARNPERREGADARRARRASGCACCSRADGVDRRYHPMAARPARVISTSPMPDTDDARGRAALHRRLPRPSTRTTDSCRAPRLEAVMASLPSDPSFDSFDRALAHVTGPRLPHDTELATAQALMDVAVRVPDRVGSLAVLDPSELPAARRRGPDRPAVHHAGRRRARALAPRRSGRRPSRSAVDARRSGCSSSRASSTSSTASIICCSCSAS